MARSQRYTYPCKTETLNDRNIQGLFGVTMSLWCVFICLGQGKLIMMRFLRKGFV